MDDLESIKKNAGISEDANTSFTPDELKLISNILRAWLYMASKKGPGESANPVEDRVKKLLSDKFNITE